MYRVFESLDALVTVVEEARGVPMTANCVVPRGEVLDLLDDLREALPGELDDAQDVLDKRDGLVADAEQEAHQTRAAATAEAEQLVTAARQEAEQLVAQARHEAERTVAEARRQHAELTERARDEAERAAQAGRAAHDRYVADGRSEQARLVSQTEVVHAARAESARMVDGAGEEAERLRRECDGYVDAKLAEFEDTLTRALRTVTQGRSRLWQTGGGPAGGPAPAGRNGHAARTGTGMDLID